ncbi:MAG: prolipoprotein diacylglyceryl transferase family protein [Candidatus Limnocylindrales bacterium]
MTLRVKGRRLTDGAKPRPGDTFEDEETLEGIVPGSGPVSVSTSVYDMEQGRWDVTAELVRHRAGTDEARPAGRSRFAGAETLPSASWSWRRRTLSSRPTSPVATRWALTAPLAVIPGVIPGSWPLLAGLGAVVGLIIQAAVLAHDGIPVGRSLAVSVPALIGGLIAAKVWYAILHPGPWRQSMAGGWAVDGFLVAALIVGVVGLLAFDLPMGIFLDAAAPGLFFGIAIGRLGCFFTGCCAGRYTGSRWGVWSSDRRIGARRVPTQLIESAAGLLLGIVTTLLVINHSIGVAGAIFVASFGLYVLFRQGILRQRSESRQFSWRRSATVSGAKS